MPRLTGGCYSPQSRSRLYTPFDDTNEKNKIWLGAVSEATAHGSLVTHCNLSERLTWCALYHSSPTNITPINNPQRECNEHIIIDSE